MHYLIAIPVLAALVIAVITDLKGQRIPNLLTLPLALGGILFHLIHGLALGGLAAAPEALGHSLGGLGLGLALMLGPWLFGIMGGGDVKLMAALGAWLGPYDILAAFLFTSLAGGVYALAVLVFRPGLLKRILHNLWVALWLAASARRAQYAPATAGERLPKLCYGLAIAAGGAAVFVRQAILNGVSL